MKYLFLNEVISERITGYWGDEGDKVNVLRTTNFTNDGVVDYSNVVTRDIPEKVIERKKLVQGDVIIEKSGGSPSQPVGRVVYFDRKDEVFICNNFTAILRSNDLVYPKYLFYFLFSLHKLGVTLKFQNKTTGIINLQLDKYLSRIQVPRPSLPEQKRIAEILDKADALRQKNKQLLVTYDELLQATFLDMFGDPVTNPKGWKTKLLSDVSGVVSGVTKGRKLNKEKVISLPYIRVANVQDGHLVLDEIKTIDALPSDLEKYRLYPGDILLTEGGDPDKLGRGAVWKSEIKDCIHQNHIYRVRITDNNLAEDYLSALIGSMYGKHYFLKAAKQTTGIATVNSTQLKKFPVIMAPIELQMKYRVAVENIEAQKELVKQSLQESEDLFNGLVQKAFSGEL